MSQALKKHTWEVTPEKVEAVIGKIIEASQPVKLILFGSYISGRYDSNSDLDVLVVVGGTREENTRKESVRIRRVLRGISMPMDIIVVLQSEWERWKDTPGLIYREALLNGKIVYES